MRLKGVNLQNFRNYKKISINTDADLVLILGDNASGKTNFLESIYFLSRLKSFRAPEQLLATHGEDFFSIEGKFNEQKLEAVVQIAPSIRRQFKIEGIKTKKALWQSYSVVLFVPNDLNIFSLGPLLRRKFIDEVLTQKYKEYAADLMSLEHILKQKSALLEQIFQNQAETNQLDFWNEQLVPVASRIQKKRQEFFDFINQRFSQTLKNLTGFENTWAVQYKTFKNENLTEELRSHQTAEVRSGKNLIGPHRDDFEIKKDGQPNLFNSSRGELRTQVLGLKLLQAEYLSNEKSKPIVLLDDVFSELDETRRTKLIENLKGCQIFITSTEEHHLPHLTKNSLVLKVANNLLV